MTILKHFNEYRSLRSKRKIFRRFKVFFQNFQLNDYFLAKLIFLGMFDALNTNLLKKIKIFTFVLILIRKPGNFAYFSTGTTWK
jgi:hypothetical protein